MTDDNTEFDFQKALKGIQEGKPMTQDFENSRFLTACVALENA